MTALMARELTSELALGRSGSRHRISTRTPAAHVLSSPTRLAHKSLEPVVEGAKNFVARQVLRIPHNWLDFDSLDS